MSGNKEAVHSAEVLACRDELILYINYKLPLEAIVLLDGKSIPAPEMVEHLRGLTPTGLRQIEKTLTLRQIAKDGR